MSSRVKTGCITCRIRRVKCDETKPQCNKCVSSRRVCDGYLQEENAMPRRKLAEVVRNLDVVGPVSRALAQRPSSSNTVSRSVSPDDAVYFDTCRHATVPGTCSLFPSAFWKQNVMQMAHDEPALWHAAIAIGVLHQRAEAIALENGDIDEKALSRRAEIHYGKALALAKNLDSTLKVATLSTTLVSAASLLGRYADMQKHIMAGLRMVAQERPRMPDLHLIEGTLMRLDMHAMTFSESSSPYPYGQSAASFPVEHFLSLPYVQGLSYDELGSEIFALFRSLMILDENLMSSDFSHGPWMTKKDTFLRRLVHWESKMAEFESTHRPVVEEEVVRLSVRLWHVIVRLFIQATLLGFQLRFDALLGQFEYAVRLAYTIHQKIRKIGAAGLTLEPGLVVPLWFVIQRCRHYWVRHAALEILENCNRTESMWRSSQAAAVLRALVAVEEEFMEPVSPSADIPALLKTPPEDIPWGIWSKPGLQLPTTLSWSNVPHIPERHRVKDLVALLNVDHSHVQVGFLMCPDPAVGSDEPGPVKEVLVNI